MTNEGKMQETIGIDRYEMENKMYDYLENAGAIKIVWLLLKTLFNNRFKLAPINTGFEENGLEVGLIATVDLTKFKHRQINKSTI